MTDLLNMLAHSSLLPSYVAKPILAGTPPPLTEIVDALVIQVMDCGATLDESSTMNERRIARAVAALAFLTALASAVPTEKN